MVRREEKNYQVDRDGGEVEKRIGIEKERFRVYGLWPTALDRRRRRSEELAH